MTSRRSPILMLTLLVVLAVVLAGIFPFRQILAQHRQVELTQTKLEALQAENARLEEEVARLHTTQEIERVARREYGLVRPGDVAFVALPAAGAPDSATPTTPELVPQPSWWQRVWDFLSGRDLIADG